jgi:glycine oxidase
MADIVIAGAGVIGLSLALELKRRGARVTILDAGRALGQASTAAAGMLAADDPYNPVELRELARLSVDLYPKFLDRLAEISELRVAFQTAYTLQGLPAGEGNEDVLEQPRVIVPGLLAGAHRFRLLDEHSVDPRQLAQALMMAVRASSIQLHEGTAVARVAAGRDGVQLETSTGKTISADFLVDCMGAWTPAPVAPVKGQMLSVELPAALPLEAVVRTEDIYIVPRTSGPNAGRAIIGATVENAGFDKTVRPADVVALHTRASALLPALAGAHFVESWAGLRPGTADGLPILGPTPRQPRYVLATGHYRNGILLAPATAHVMAQVLLGETPAVDLQAFRPERF